MAPTTAFLNSIVTYAWATFIYLLAYRAVIILAPIASIVAQTLWRLLMKRDLRLPAALRGFLAGAAARPSARGLCGALLEAARAGPFAFTGAIAGTHFLTAYPLLLLGPLLGRDVLLSQFIGTALLIAMVAIVWQPSRLELLSEDDVSPASSLRNRAILELKEVGPQIIFGLLAGGMVAAWGLSVWRIELASALGGGLTAQIGSAVVGTALGSISCLPPVASLFVATYIWKAGIAHAGLVSFLLASAATPVRRKLYRRLLGKREGAKLWWILLLCGPLAGIATAVVFRLLGLTIHYRLVREQLL